ncbi:MAG: hypothetical protein KDE48_02705 [Anaerolineales bacterium]|nr:hypothetical protein [Anaerolineales bacterium]
MKSRTVWITIIGSSIFFTGLLLSIALLPLSAQENHIEDAKALPVANAGSITIVKDADPADGTAFHFQTNLLPPQTFVTRWGKNNGDGQAGTLEGEFRDPTNVAVDNAGNVFVADYYHSRIQKFDSEGNFLRMWGFGVDDGTAEFQICTSGCQPGLLSNESGGFWNVNGVAVDADGNVYTTDITNHIQKFDNDGNFQIKWGTMGSGDGQLNGPFDIVVDDAGNVYVAEFLNHRIQKFNSSGAFLSTWGFGVQDGSLTYQICTSGCQAGIPGNGDGQFNQPTGITLDKAGDIYTTEGNNHRIQKFDSDGNFLLKWGSQGSGDGQLYSPQDLAVDSAGHVYVSDNNHRIQKFDNNGNFLHVWDGGLGINGQFYYPDGVAIDQAGNLYVAEYRRNRIQKFVIDPFALYDGGVFSNTITFNNLLAGTYHFTETLSAGWTLEDIQCSGGSTVTNPANRHVEIDFSVSDTVICTFVNKGNSITITKAATPADGTNFAFQTDLLPPLTFRQNWGQSSLGAGFYNIAGLAINGFDNIYVGRRVQSYIQKFDSNRNYLLRWGVYGYEEEGQFDRLNGVAVAPNGFVYALDEYRHRVQKFDNNGAFILGWGIGGFSEGQFQFPEGIAVDDAGNVYVSDTDNARVQKFDSNGNFLRMWGWGVAMNPPAFEICTSNCYNGEPGSGNGQFDHATGITTDSNGNVYVADTGNKRIQKFDSDGNYLLQWGSAGSGDGQFSSPIGIIVDSVGNVYVADYARIQKFDSNGNFLLKWGNYGSGNGEFDNSKYLAVDSADNIYVADVGNNRIQQFDSSGNFLNTWNTPNNDEDGILSAPLGVSTDSQENVYVVDAGNDRIQKFDRQGNFVLKWGSGGSGDGQFTNPAYIAIDSADNVYVTDPGLDRIQKFDSNGNFLLKWDVPGYPYGVAIDSMDNIYVVNNTFYQIEKFDSNGNFIRAWGGSGVGDGQFSSPQDIAIDSADNVYVTDSGLDRIQKFDGNGNFLLKWNSSNLGDSWVQGITIDAVDNVYVTDLWGDRIQKFDSHGNFLHKWRRIGHGDGQFSYPMGIAADGVGHVYVTDIRGDRIQQFATNVFALDAAVPDDGDTVSDTITFSGGLSGTMQFTETVSTDWLLSSIVCNGGMTTTDLANRSVSVTPADNDAVTCTFDNHAFRLAIDAFSNSTLQLMWGDTATNCVYDVHENTAPYFMLPGTMIYPAVNSPLPLPQLGDVNTNYFYRLKAVCDLGAAAYQSNEGGEFDFTIVPGS